MMATLKSLMENTVGESVRVATSLITYKQTFAKMDSVAGAQPQAHESLYYLGKTSMQSFCQLLSPQWTQK